MEKIRKIVAYKHYFEEFLLQQPVRVQDKIYKILEAIEILERIPTTYLKLVTGTAGLYEARIQLGSDIWRVFVSSIRGSWLFSSMVFRRRLKKHQKVKLRKQYN